jgi:hypothetical protein
MVASSASIALTISDTGIKKAELSVTGFSFDTIDKIGSVSEDGTVPKDWHELV